MDTSGERQKQPRWVMGGFSGTRSSEFSPPVRHGSSEVGSHPPLPSLQGDVLGWGPASRTSKPSIPKRSLAVRWRRAPGCDKATQNGLIPLHWLYDRYFASSAGGALSLRRSQLRKQSNCCDCSHREQGRAGTCSPPNFIESFCSEETLRIIEPNH